MNCLHCGKPIIDSGSAIEKCSSWHDKCIKKFFGTTKLPEIDVSEKVIEELALKSTTKGYTVPGVQKKISLHLTKGNNPRLTLINYPTGFIIKPQTEEFIALPEAEYLVMQMAVTTGIKTVPFALVKMPSQNDKFAYITRRIDRILPRAKTNKTQMLAMEDFCQLDGRLTQDKYRGSYERCAKLITKYSTQLGLDLSELFLRIVFSFVIGNSDMHLKNFSLIETAEGINEYILSDAYDMIPVNVVLPEDNEQLALTLNGKKQNVRKKDFLEFSATIRVPANSAEKMISKIISMEDKYISMCRNSYIPDYMKELLENLIRERILILKK